MGLSRHVLMPTMMPSWANTKPGLVTALAQMATSSRLQVLTESQFKLNLRHVNFKFNVCRKPFCEVDFSGCKTLTIGRQLIGRARLGKKHQFGKLIAWQLLN